MNKIFISSERLDILCLENTSPIHQPIWELITDKYASKKIQYIRKLANRNRS